MRITLDITRWGRALYLQGYASYLKDSLVSELCSLDRSLMLSIDLLPVPTDEAVKEIQNKLLGVETNVSNWQRRGARAANTRLRLWKNTAAAARYRFVDGIPDIPKFAALYQMAHSERAVCTTPRILECWATACGTIPGRLRNR